MKKHIFLTVLTVLAMMAFVSLLIAIAYGKFSLGKESVTPDTTTCIIVSYDTIPYLMPVVKDSVVVRYVTQRLPIVSQDTARESQDTTILLRRDTANVIIPITQKQYTDSTYTAWVSGYEAQLDSIKVYRQMKDITKTVTIKRKIPPWSVGLTAGYGAGKGGLTPYIGIGVTYRLFGLGKRE